MRKIFPVFLCVSAALALAPVNASPVSGSAGDAVDEVIVDQGAASPLVSIRELWQTLPSEIADELQEFRTSLNLDYRTTLVPTGDAETDWKTKAIDVSGHLESLPGGIDGNALLAVGEVPMLRFFGKIPAAILADWEYIQAGSKAVAPAEANGGSFLAIGPHHIVFIAEDEIEADNARCMKTAIDRAADHMTVYRYSGVPFDRGNDASLEAEAEAIVMHNLIGGLSSPIFCSIIERDKEGRFRNLSYTTDGRPLANMNDQNDHLEFVSSVDLYQQLNVNYTAEAAGDEPFYPAEEATEPL